MFVSMFVYLPTVSTQLLVGCVHNIILNVIMPCCTLHRLKAEIESLRLKNDASLSSVRSNHDAEICRLHDQLAESDSIRQQQIEQLQYDHARQLEELRQETADLSECSESTRRKLEREKNSLEAELTKALQDLVMVKIVTDFAVDSRNCCDQLLLPH